MRRTRWAAGVMLVAAVAAGGVANAVDSNYLATGRHTVQHGEVGEEAVVGNFQVRVHGAVSSDRLGEGDVVDGDVVNGDVVTSPGMFVVVDAAYATTDAWATPEEVVLIDGDGREFTEPAGFGSDGRAWEAGPDIWFRGTLLFEVPADAVGDLTLELRPETPNPQLPSSVLRIPLTVDTTGEPVTAERARLLAEGER